MENPVHITEKALVQIKNIISSKNLSKEYGLRLFVDGFGSCGSGAKHSLGFDKQKKTDQTFLFEDILCLYDKKHLLYLIGMELDYQKEGEQTGFFFQKSTHRS